MKVGRQGFTRAGLACVIFAATLSAADGASPAVRRCSGLRLPKGTLKQALTTLGRERGFEVTFGYPRVAQLPVAGGALEGTDCVAELTGLFEALRVSFALSEGAGKSVRKLLVGDFKLAQPAGGPPVAASDAAARPESPTVAREAPAEDTTTPKPEKDKAPDPEDLIDMGDGMKVYKVAPPYVPMTPGLIPPNAVLTGAEAPAETFFGADSEKINPVLAAPASTPVPLKALLKAPPAVVGARPPNANPPSPTPTPRL